MFVDVGYEVMMLPGGLLFKIASHTLIFRINALSSCSTWDSNVSELERQKLVSTTTLITKQAYIHFLKKIMRGKPDGKQRRLRNLKHKSLYWVMLFVHDDHHNLLCIILVEKSKTSARVARAQYLILKTVTFRPFLTFSMSGFTQCNVSWIYWFSSGWHDI